MRPLFSGKIAGANATIEAFKKSANPALLKSAENEFARLRLVNLRYAPAVKVACDKFTALSQDKETLEKHKKAVRDKPDEYSKTVMERYRNAINHYSPTQCADASAALLHGLNRRGVPTPIGTLNY